MSATLDKIIEEIRTLPADEKRQLREMLEREAREADQGERAKLSRSIRGKYAHLLTDSETFIAQKREETRREDSKFGGRP
ncbi:MAG: hypothetical protein M3348_06460 [Acidobacteriota bacterium]|nr:hypothetical protein [Acidobacteriota bacterium]